MDSRLFFGIWTSGAAVISFLIAAVSGKYLIPFLHKLNFGQTILDDGPKWHKSKQGTPIMGGFMFIISILLVTIISTLVYFFSGASIVNTFYSDVSRECAFIFAGLGLAVANGLIGFVDDYTKVVKKRNLGLTPKQKLIFQFIAAAFYLFVLKIAGYGSQTIIPFVGEVDLGIFYYIIATVAIVGVVNSVNLTDGVDGLNGSVTLFYCIVFMMISSMLSCFGVSVMCAVSAGACLGFLVWNFHPAKVFMGDTGSLFLGGLVCGIAFAVNMPILIILVGIIYIAEEGSVILQVSYFKLTHGKRIFKMSPLHHHFEMCGWSEVKIVSVFSAVTALFGTLAFALVFFGLK
ncbi:MAG: phospho-N-acetylmuramoyl-pentapeptide-transferase [Ruminococcus sp.]|nr:phospho-N-acetylmuramoyl-pentapeptide-transferase [Ruminococcus sp.]